MYSVGVLTILAAAALSAPSSLVQPAAQSASTGDMSPQAKTYLERAITLFREQHINAAKMD